MTVESLVSKVISEEVEKVFSEEKVEEIYNKKIERYLKEAVKKRIEKKDFLENLIIDYFDSYHAKNIIKNCLVKHLQLKMIKE